MMPLSTPLTVGILVILPTAFTPSAHAFDYEPTAMSKALAAHDLVLVAKVSEQAGGNAKLVPVTVIKGKAPSGAFTLPDTWRPGSEFTFGPVTLAVGKTYLLMLHADRDGRYVFSKDFAAPAVVRVSSEDDPLVRTATVLYALSQKETMAARKEVLAGAWEKESAATKRKLLEEFFRNLRDEATVPFLVQAMNAGKDHSSLMEWAALAIKKHRYKEAIPDVLKVLQKREEGSLYAAQTLAALKAQDAFEPIMDLIENPVVGNRPYFIEALAQLEDKRAIPFLMKTLTRNLPGLDLARGTYRSWDLQENEFAAQGLGRLRAVEAVEPLTQVLKLEAPAYGKLQTLAVTSLGEIGPKAKAAVPAIRQLMQNDRVPKEVSAEALKNIEK